MEKQKESLERAKAEKPYPKERKQKKRNRKQRGEKDITYQNKDVASKVTGEALVGHSLAPFGLPHIKITAALPTNLPALESNELRLDNLFLLEDEAIAIIDYESVCLVNMDTRLIYDRLSAKIHRQGWLNTEDLLQLMVFPLTVKGMEGKQEAILQAVELAKKIEDRNQKTQVLAGILTFTDKVIDKDYREKVKEEWVMTQIGKMIYDDGFNAGKEQGKRQGEKRGIQWGENRKLVSLVCRKLRKGKEAETIAQELEESLEIIESICQAASEYAPDYDEAHVYKAWSA